MDSVKKNKQEPESKPILVKNAADLQRMKLEKLMKNPDKPVIIPERLKEKKLPHVPDFVRNVMGSSAGAGSGEFHVYRHLRRKEYARQKYIQGKGEKAMLDEAYQNKIEENRKAAEERTAKKRAKRLKKKAKRLKKKNEKEDPSKKNEDTDSEYSDSDIESKNDKSNENASEKCSSESTSK